MAKYWKNKKSWQKDKEREAINKISHLSLSQVEAQINALNNEIKEVEDYIKKGNEEKKNIIKQNLPEAIKIYLKLELCRDGLIDKLQNEINIINNKKPKSTSLVSFFYMGSDVRSDEDEKKIEKLVEYRDYIERGKNRASSYFFREIDFCFDLEANEDNIDFSSLTYEEEDLKLLNFFIDSNIPFTKGDVSEDINRFFSYPKKFNKIKTYIINELGPTPDKFTAENFIELDNKIHKLLDYEDFEYSDKYYTLINRIKKYKYELKPFIALRSILSKKEKSARLKAYENKARDGTATLKTSLKEQFKILNKCPYCRKEIAFETCHADHIYPIAKGGLTTKSNMVLVCEECNRSKSKSTLRQFAKKYKLNLDQIEKDLDLLGKDF